MRTRVAVIDYGGGNARSLMDAFSAVPAWAYKARLPRDLDSAHLLLLPGVGHARSALEQARAGWVAEALSRWNEAGRPLLGICLGAQMLYEWLEEAMLPGFGWLEGTVSRITGGATKHTGWTSLDIDALKRTGLATRLSASSSFYFNHQFALPRTGASGEVISKTGRTAIMRDRNLFAVQFHPEKSQQAGRQFLKNVVEASRHV